MTRSPGRHSTDPRRPERTYRWRDRARTMSLQNLRFRSRMLLLVGIFLAGLAATHVMYALMLSSVRVNGPLYHRIAQGKDITGELIPPPVMESYVLVIHLLEEKDPARRQAL